MSYFRYFLLSCLLLCFLSYVFLVLSYSLSTLVSDVEDVDEDKGILLNVVFTFLQTHQISR